MQRILVYGMTSNIGGMEVYLIRLFRYLDKSKIMFDFIVESDHTAFSNELQAANSMIYQVPPKGSHPIKHMRALWDILRRYPAYDTVYFNILNANAAFSILPFLIKKRRIVVHSHNTGDPRMLMHGIARPILNRIADVRLACSEAAAKFMFGEKKSVNSKVSIIKNPVDTSEFKFNPLTRAQTRRTLNLEDANIILHVGRISAQKNPFFMLDVMKATIERNPAAVLLYVGTGELEEQVRSHVNQLGIANRVRFLGLRDDIPMLMCAADVFFLPSIYEGLGIVLIEAQAAGLRCVCSNTIQPEARLLPGNTYLPLDAPLSQWVEALCKNSETQNREAAAEKVLSFGFGNESEYKKALSFITGED